ncbi:VanZ family protein [Glutamicibacter arilaitensis]|uniref:VanZ family protein n=1 Tax=Glutamicibacter arilaitensis TaxID=256701 RepID=UPI00384CE7D1
MTNAIRAFGWLVPWFFLFSIIVLIAMLLVNRFSKRPNKRDIRGTLGLWVSVCWYIGVVMITIIPDGGSVPIQIEGEDRVRFSLVPLDGWFDQYGLNLVAVRESALNALLFVPGMILTLWFTAMRTKVAFGVLIGFGALIEITQLLTNWGRALTATDVIMYALGTIFGWGIYALLRRAGAKKAGVPTLIDSANN